MLDRHDAPGDHPSTYKADVTMYTKQQPNSLSFFPFLFYSVFCALRSNIVEAPLEMFATCMAVAYAKQTRLAAAAEEV